MPSISGVCRFLRDDDDDDDEDDDDDDHYYTHNLHIY